MHSFKSYQNPFLKSFFSEYQRLCCVAVFVGFLGNGCSELVIKDEDDGSVIIGKIMYRTAFAIGTLGYSEVKMHEVTQEYEREQKWKAFQVRVMEFLENGEITQAQAEQMILKEKERIWKEDRSKD